jgi:AAA domain, putative AbiEii toxin, Type IV TA system
MLKRLQLSEVGPARELAFEFSDRLNLLTGDNGLGKSFVLDVAWWALSRTWASEPAAPHRGRMKSAAIRYEVKGSAKPSSQVVHFDLDSWSWKRQPGRKPNPGLVIYAQVDGGFAVWDPLRNYWRDEARRPEAAKFEDSFLFSKGALWNGLERRSTVLCNGLLRDWVSWQQRSGSPEFETLRRVLDVLAPGGRETFRPGEPVRVSPQDALDYPTLELPYGTVPLIHASSGAQRILGLAYLIVWTWHEHLKAAAVLGQSPTKSIVLLVDELEAHLHPRWQRRILPALLEVVKTLDPEAQVQVIAVTHAPLLLASIETQFKEDIDTLFAFDLTSGPQPEVICERAAWAPRGDANSWLISDVFDLKEPRSLEAEQALEKARAALREPGLSILEVRKIHHELHAVLKDTDPFWLRWEARARAAGIEV